MRRRIGGVVVAALVAVSAGCQNDDGDGDDAAGSTTTAAVAVTVAGTTGTTALAGAPPARGECFMPGDGVSSRADFDGQNGGFVVQMQAFDVPGRTLSFDVIQFLLGQDAIREYRRQNPAEPNGLPPNDYMTVNALVKTDQARVSANPTVWLLDPATGRDLARSNFAALSNPPTRRSFGPYGLYWLVFESATVTRLCQIFTP